MRGAGKVRRKFILCWLGRIESIFYTLLEKYFLIKCIFFTETKIFKQEKHSTNFRGLL